MTFSMRRIFVIGAMLIAFGGCGTAHYRNSLHPSYGQVEFDRDWYECRRENTYVDQWSNPAGSYTDLAVNEQLAGACLAARGWHSVKE